MSRWAPEIKVYSRRNPRKNPKPPPEDPTPDPNPPPEPSPDPNPHPEPCPIPNSDPLEQTLASFRRSIRRPEAEDAVPPLSDPAAPTSPPPLSPTSSPHGAPAAASGDFSSGLARDGAAVPNGHADIDIRAAADDKARKRRVRSELRRQLASELDQVRVLSKRLKAAGEALAVEASQSVPRPPPLLTAGYVQPQFSGSDAVTPVQAPVAASVPPVRSFLPRRPLIVPEVHTESLDKEKRTPKANQLYQNSEFLLAKDRIPPSDSHGRKKTKHHKKKHRSSSAHGAGYNAEQRLYSHAFKKSSSLLSRLMKHKFGWVFNKPVDPVALGLHDYFAIIKHPMDLGTIKGQLTRGHYRDPKEFANDVRLTFHNAMTYNPKGQDVHFMAEQLLGIFEAQWPEIEAEVDYLASCPPLPKKFPPPPIDLRLLERSDSLKHHMVLDSKSRPISHTPISVRTPSLKKPKAKDLDKRDMTIDEKRKLSNNLQNLPPEKLDIVVQIIKNKNLSVRQHEDEIEVEIDSMDAETLWELDRFVANFKKNLSKQKRKAERAMLARQDVELRALHAAQQTSQQPNIGEKSPKLNLMVGEQLAPSVPDQNNNNGPSASRSSSSSSTSSDSDSSSSDSDSDSSSTDGSNAANSS
ncbi:transcription factor GTE4 [Triticum aestivum]|uniref:transcription factor GTE4 n=1 Tax=Triticum aestivum TaxID=4565 RepID=UPI001D00CC8A|nr:transcription factor GTE4-like [Triticum aestivum]